MAFKALLLLRRQKPLNSDVTHVTPVNTLNRDSSSDVPVIAGPRTTLNTSERDLNLDLPVIGSLVYCESSALNYAATEVGHTTFQQLSPRYKGLLKGRRLVDSRAYPIKVSPRHPNYRVLTEQSLSDLTLSPSTTARYPLQRCITWPRADDRHLRKVAWRPPGGTGRDVPGPDVPLLPVLFATPRSSQVRITDNLLEVPPSSTENNTLSLRQSSAVVPSSRRPSAIMQLTAINNRYMMGLIQSRHNSCADTHDPERGNPPTKSSETSQAGSDALTMALSALYAKLLVVLGIAFPVTEVLSERVPANFYQFLLYRYDFSDSRKDNSHPKKPHDGPIIRYGSFYLRLGAIAFGIGSMVYSGLEFGQYFELKRDSKCSDILLVLTPATRMILTLVQMQFIFLNSMDMKMSTYKVVARFGLMHMIAANLCEWLYVLVEETRHEIRSSDTHDIYECRRSNIMGSLVQNASPFLFPCTIEYSLICAVILYEMWKNVKPEMEEGSKRGAFRMTVNTPHSLHHFTVDCTSAHKGLFSGILVLVLTIISLILFFVLNEDPQYKQTAVFEVNVCELVLYIISTIAVIVCMIQMRGLNLLVMAQTGMYIYCMFSIIGCSFGNEDSLAPGGMATELSSLIQTTCQTVFVLDASWRRCRTANQARRKPGRQIITFLLVANMAMWAINTLEKGHAEFRPSHLKFFGVWAWTVITHVSMPLAIFYRFHSTICLFEIWKSAYKMKLRKSEYCSNCCDLAGSTGGSELGPIHESMSSMEDDEEEEEEFEEENSMVEAPHPIPTVEEPGSSSREMVSVHTRDRRLSAAARGSPMGSPVRRARFALGSSSRNELSSSLLPVMIYQKSHGRSQSLPFIQKPPVFDKRKKDQTKFLSLHALSVILSALYGKLLIVLGLAFPLAQIMSAKVPPSFYEGFYLYLYFVSMLFLLCMYGLVLKQKAVESVLMGTTKSHNKQVETDGDTDAMLEAGIKPKTPTVTAKRSRYGSFYLRMGAVAFGIGSMIYSGLEFGQYFELEKNTNCHNVLLAVTPATRMAFVILQMQFIFLSNKQLSVRKFKVVTRFGLIHMMATNLCVWLNVLVQETKHEIFNFYTTGSKLSEALREDSFSCRRTNIMGTLVQNASPFLFPCTIEYSLICAVILYAMWKDVSALHGHSKQGCVDFQLSSRTRPSQQFSVDCASAHKGLFAGILVLVLTIISLIMFFVLVKEPDYGALAVLEVDIVELTLYLLTTLAVCACAYRIKELKYDTNRRFELDNTLLVMAQTGLYVYSLFSIIAGYFSTSEGRPGIMLASLASFIQTTLQTMFILDAWWRRCTTAGQMRRRPGRQLVTFLLVTNMALWVVNRLENARAEFHPRELQFYGVPFHGVPVRDLEEHVQDETNSAQLLGSLQRFHNNIIMTQFGGRMV
uniref:Otopetrin n=1 Tax=Timema monikensis TaxID=170555 RepID=A0A7R9HID5_9NEOP|nr:unnamed protein product [Timema monikensis]